jgi:hypothetical protein
VSPRANEEQIPRFARDDSCPNCGSASVEKFCAHCGELQPAYRDHSFKAVATQALEEFGNLDGKIPRTLWALITRPGLLTREFIVGGRQRFAKPMSLFVVLNIVFFLVQPHTGLLQYHIGQFMNGRGVLTDVRRDLVRKEMARTGETKVQFGDRFEATFAEQKKSMLLFAVPVFAGALALMFFRSRRQFMEHLVFSVHAYCFLLVVLTLGVWTMVEAMVGWLRIAWLAGANIAWSQMLFGEMGVTIMIFVPSALYLAAALRRAYDVPLRSAATRGFVLSAVQLCLVLLYRDVLFFTTLIAIR